MKIADKIFVINRDMDIGRMELTRGELWRAGFPDFERFSAICPNGGATRKDRLLGCKLSHYEIYKRILAEGWERTLIFEDDVVFKDGIDLLSAFRNIDDFLGRNKWHLFYLGSGNYQGHGDVIWPDIRRCKRSATTFAYMVHIGIAEKLVEVSEKTMDISESVPDGYADNTLMDHIQPLGLSFYHSPNIAYQRAGVSTISGRGCFYAAIYRT